MTVPIFKRDIAELKWLGRQDYPVWGGHIQRGEELQDRKLLEWIAKGLVAQVGNGYVLTAKGRRLIQAHH